MNHKIEELKHRLGQAAVFLDFDGTLSPIVADPNEARPLPKTVATLEQLARKAAVVAVVSGRPLSFLTKTLGTPQGVELRGLYGAQRLVAGQVVEADSMSRWRQVVEDGVLRAEAELPVTVRVERKGGSFALHYRNSPENRQVVEQWAAAFAAASGLDAERGRMAIELGPFSVGDKGAAVAELSKGLRCCCVIGDDIGDLPMFRSAEQLFGNQSLNILVDSAEVPNRLREASDMKLGGPTEVLGLLEYLATP